MPTTIDQLRRQLSTIEPNEAMYAGIGASEIPLLKQLLNDPEPWMSARAIFALSRIADESAVEIIRKSIHDVRPEVRVAIAASATNLAVNDSNTILAEILDDKDVGVRKFAVQSVSSKNDLSIHAKLKMMEAQDPVSLMRDHARLRRRELENKKTIPPVRVNPFEKVDPRIKK